MKLLILDRDGVINHDSDAYIKSVEEWLPLPGAIEAIAQLSKAGWTVAIATNQSGIARGYYDIATLDAIHARLRALVAQQADLRECWFVGDSLGDLQAAEAVGSQPVLVKTGKGEKTFEKNLPATTLIFDDLAAVAAELIHT